MFLIFVFNLFYVANILPFSLNIAFIWTYISYNYHFEVITNILAIAALIVFALVCIVLKKWRLLIMFCLGFLYLYISLQIFGALGGLVK